MSSYSANSPCPCASRIKYKKCCSIYHKGANPKTALLLMKSRYSAFAIGDSRYIIKSTHPDNSDYTADIKSWQASIDTFSRDTKFFGLEILDSDLGEDESFVTFCAKLSIGDLVERSRFLKVDGMWLYIDAEFDISKDKANPTR